MDNRNAILVIMTEETPSVPNIVPEREQNANTPDSVEQDLNIISSDTNTPNTSEPPVKKAKLNKVDVPEREHDTNVTDIMEQDLNIIFCDTNMPDGNEPPHKTSEPPQTKPIYVSNVLFYVNVISKIVGETN